MRSLRFVFVSWKLQFKMIMRSPFDGIGNGPGSLSPPYAV